MEQLICLKCKQKRFLTNEEIKESGKHVKDKNLTSGIIPRYWSMMDGIKCSNNTSEHKYLWYEEYEKKTTEDKNKIIEFGKEITKDTEETEEIEEKIEQLSRRKDELKEKIEKNIVNEKNKRIEFEESTGIEPEKWL